MAKVDVLDILRTKKLDPLEFHFENLWIPPINCYLSPSDIEALHKIATSARLSSKIQQKYKMIDDIMVARGFKRFSAGTNRVVYRFLEDTRFLVKIAVDKVGMQDNPLEYENQFLLQPFVTKMFYVSPCGTVGFSERVLPIKNKEEFRQIASDVFDILVNKILGLYVVEDVGTRYFMNWGIRPGFGPVLLDYPYVYKLDGDKLFCNWTNPITGECCNGEIDYDAGFNHLVCTRCNKTYMATDLRDNSIDNKIVIKRGGFQMRIQILQGDQIVGEPIPTDDVMIKPASKPKKNTTLVVAINRPDSEPKVINDMADNNPEDKVVKTVGVVIETPTVDDRISKDINHIIRENNMWTPEADDKDVSKDDTDSSEEDVSDTGNEIDVSSDHFDDNDTEVEPESIAETHDNEDEPDMVFASDIDLQKPKPRRNEKGQFISSEDGPKKGKKKKNRDGTKSTFIPRSN
jgi:hypothetical protein